MSVVFAMWVSLAVLWLNVELARAAWEQEKSPAGVLVRAASVVAAGTVFAASLVTLSAVWTWALS